MSTNLNKNNPANTPEVPEIPKDFIPMTQSVQRLQVAERDGFHRHWFRGTPERIARAQQAGYRFVDQDAINLNNFDLGGDAKQSGNTDLGSRVSVISGDDMDSSGQPARMYLMECPSHLFEVAQKHLFDRNEAIADALRGGKIGQDKMEYNEARKTYTRGSMPDLFTPKRTRRA